MAVMLIVHSSAHILTAVGSNGRLRLIGLRMVCLGVLGDVAWLRQESTMRRVRGWGCWPPAVWYLWGE